MDKMGLPRWVVRLAYRLVDVEKYSPTTDERVLEYSFAIGKLSRMEPGNLLDVGCVARMNLVPAVACELGWKVWGIDIRNYNFSHPNFTFTKGNILDNLFPLKFFDAITAISTIEHIGIKGRYGLSENIVMGDMSTFNEIRDILKKEGKLIATVPFGNTYKISTLGRTYDEEHLKWFCRRWTVLEKRVGSNLAMLELEK